MGRLDDLIAHYRKQLQRADESDYPFFRVRQWINGSDVTQEVRGRRVRNAGLFRRIIAALTERND
jgi:hypothetical protein